MQVAVRADASTIIGAGHIIRCLTLLTHLRKQLGTLQALFICRDHPGCLSEHIIAQDFDIALLPMPSTDSGTAASTWLGETQALDADQSANIIAKKFGNDLEWLIIDHYGIGYEWESSLRELTRHIMVIDDLANRPHDCDILLDQTYGISADSYSTLTPKACRVLTGSSYTLLRDEFRISRDEIFQLRDKNWPPRRLLISLGGSDPKNLTQSVLEALLPVSEQFSITIIAGPSFTHTDVLRALCKGHPNISLIHSPDNMAALMLSHDIAIGATGGTSWERCAMGLPAVTLTIADNQKNISLNLVRAGAIKLLEEPVKHDILEATMQPWLTDRSAYMEAVQSSLEICDAMGTERVIEAILDQ